MALWVDKKGHHSGGGVDKILQEITEGEEGSGKKHLAAGIPLYEKQHKTRF